MPSTKHAAAIQKDAVFRVTYTPYTDPKCVPQDLLLRKIKSAEQLLATMNGDLSGSDWNNNAILFGSSSMEFKPATAPRVMT
jgi:hypothetical protein